MQELLWAVWSPRKVWHSAQMLGDGTSGFPPAKALAECSFMVYATITTIFVGS